MLNIILIFLLQAISTQAIAKSWDHKTTYIKFKKLEFSIEAYFKDCPHLASEFKNWNQILQSKSPCWNGPYIKNKEIKDPFNNTILIKRLSPSHIGLVSKGFDKIINTRDDIRSEDNSDQRRSVGCYYKTKNKHFIKKLICQFPNYIFFILTIFIIAIGFMLKK